jgi:hypothetical protein
MPLEQELKPDLEREESLQKFDRDHYIREYIFGRDMLYIIDKWEQETFMKPERAISSEPSVGESSGSESKKRRKDRRQDSSLSNS